MMKVLLITVGTRGDVQPFMVLARELKARGHQVCLCTHEKFSGFIRDQGIDYKHMNNQLMEFMESDLGKFAMENFTSLFSVLKNMKKIIPKVRGLQKDQITDQWRAVCDFAPEHIVYSPKAFCAPSFAEALGISCTLMAFQPMSVPTSTEPAMLFPNLRLGAWYNRATYFVTRWITARGTRGYINAWRKKQTLPKWHDHPNTDRKGKPIPTIYGFSEKVYPRPRDFPDWATISGFLFLEKSPDWEPNPKLVQFLNAGERPIYVGFGSISGSTADRLATEVVATIQKLKLRAVLFPGWGGLELQKLSLSDNFFVLDSTPHDWLFPKMATVVHHGGLGTFAAALLAGVPQVICPFFGDQPYWGKKAFQLGVGPQPIPQKKLSRIILMEALRHCLESKQCSTQAKKISSSLSAEDGSATAASFVERALLDYRSEHAN